MERSRPDEVKNGEEMTIDKLALMIGNGFAHVDKQFEKVGSEVQGLKQGMDDGFAAINTRLDTLRDDMVRRQEFDDALARIKYIERKLGIESGV